jgi:hypothetical protein
MPEIGTSGLMSGDGKRGDGQRPQATAPILDSTRPDIGANRGQPGPDFGPSNVIPCCSIALLVASKVATDIVWR